jgi:transposase
VADHDSGHVVWIGKERTKATFGAFFDALGPVRAEAVEAISLDGSSIYLPVAGLVCSRHPRVAQASTQREEESWAAAGQQRDTGASSCEPLRKAPVRR